MLKNSASILLSLFLLNSCVSPEKRIVKHNQQKKDVAATNNEVYYCNLKRFTARTIEGKVYLNWIIVSNTPNYYFVLEKIVDSTTTIIDIKKGAISPNNIELLFCYTDKDSTNNSITYRINAVQPLKNGNDILLYPHQKNLFKNQNNNIISITNNCQYLSYSKIK